MKAKLESRRCSISGGHMSKMYDGTSVSTVGSPALKERADRNSLFRRGLFANAIHPSICLIRSTERGSKLAIVLVKILS
jgi:hypothetical protein